MAIKGKYKLKNKFLINKTYSGIYNNLENKHLETEAVFGEEFFISKTTKNYSLAHFQVIIIKVGLKMKI